mgnify:FL=1
MLSIRSVVEWAKKSLESCNMSVSRKEDMFRDVYSFSQKVLYKHLNGGWMYTDFDMVAEYAMHCLAYGLWIQTNDGTIPVSSLSFDAEDMLNLGERSLDILCSLPEHDIFSSWVTPDLCKKYWLSACSDTPPHIQSFWSYFSKRWKYDDVLTDLVLKKPIKELMWKDWCALHRLSGGEGSPCDHVLYYTLQHILKKTQKHWVSMSSIEDNVLSDIISSFSHEVQSIIRRVWKQLCSVSPAQWEEYKRMEFCLVEQAMHEQNDDVIDWATIKKELGLKVLAVLVATDKYESLKSIKRWKDVISESDLHVCDADMVPHVIEELNSAGLLSKKEETYLKRHWVEEVDEWISKPKSLWT